MDPTSPRPAADRSNALAALDRGAAFLESGDYQHALEAYGSAARVGSSSETADAAIVAAGFLGLGEALYRLDRDDEARGAWEAVLELPETPSTYRAWRNVAGARVRLGDLPGAIAAYRQAERRAPAEDRAEIASRLGWLAKETGDTKAAGRYFARSRGDGPAFLLSWLILAVTIVVSVVGWSPDGAAIERLLMLDKPAIAAGEYWRLLSVTLTHDGPLHLFFNMYALYLVGPAVERTWGSLRLVLFWVLTAVAGSVASYVFSGGAYGVGASGAVFGLVGVLMAGVRIHHPVLDWRARGLVGQLGMVVAINLAFGFASGGMIDNAAHIGGLVGGLWLGAVVPPGRGLTLRNFWTLPNGTTPGGVPVVVSLIGVIALAGVLFAGLAVGAGRW